MFPCVFLSAAVLLLPMAEPKVVPKTRVDRDHAVKIALAHLNIDRVTKEPSTAFNLHVREDKLTLAGISALENPRLGAVTKHKDAGGLPDSVEVFHITVQHGLVGDSSVFVAKDGGRVILVQFMPEG